MKTRNILTSTLMVSSAFLVIGCGSVSDVVKTLAKLTATVPASAGGSQLQAICTDGTIKTSTAVTTEQSVSLDVPTNTDCSLNLITNKNNDTARVITPIEVTNGQTTGKSVNLTKDVTLPTLTVGTRNNGNQVSLATKVEVKDLKDNELKTKQRADDKNGDDIPDIYERNNANDDTPKAFVKDTKENKAKIDIDNNKNGVPDFLETNGNKTGKADLLNDSEGDKQPDFDDDKHTSKYDDDRKGGNTPAMKKFATDVMPIFNDKCKSCHPITSNRIFKVGTASETFKGLIDNKLIDKITAINSKILQKNDGTLSHDGGQKLPKTSIEYITIKAWIMAGAKND